MPGQGQSAPIAPGIKVSNFNVTSPGVLGVTMRTMPSKAGWKSIPNGYTFTVNAGEPFFTGTLTLTLDLPSSITAGQAAMLSASKFDESGNEQLLQGSLSGNKLRFNLSSFSTFRIQAPVYSTPTVASGGGTSVLSGEAAVSLQPLDVSAPDVRTALALIHAGGRIPVGSILRASPQDVALSPAAVVSASYDPAVLGALGVSQEALGLYQFDAAGVLERLPLQSLDRDARRLEARALRLRPFLAVFADTAAVALADTLAPVTTLVQAASSTLVSLTAIDPADGPFPVSGVAFTRYLLDAEFIDIASTPGVLFEGPFSVTPGEHTLTYYSVDYAGNVEQPAAVSFTIEGKEDPAPGGTLALAADGAGRLWSVYAEGGTLRLGRHSGLGELETSIELPGTSAIGRWTVQAGAEAVYAVGTTSASGPPRLAVFKASLGGELLSTALSPDEPGLMSIALDAGGDLWITGAVITGEGEQQSVAMALWRYAQVSGQIERLGGYTRGAGGLDVGTGVRVFAGAVWVAGLSRAAGTMTTDLGLWRFSTDGALLTPPLFLPGYFGESDKGEVRLETLQDRLYAVAARARQPDSADLGLIALDADGGVAFEKRWQPAAGSALPVSLRAASGGELVVAGAVFEGDSARPAAWRYAPSGELLSAETSAAPLGVPQDAALLGPDLWLALPSSLAPVLFAGQPLSGQDILISSRAVFLAAPRTTLSIGQPSFGAGPVLIASTTLLALSVDDPQARTFVAVDTAAFALYTAPFTLAAEGEHALRFYSERAPGGVEAVNVSSLTVDAAAPALSLALPGDASPAFCRVFEGRIALEGAVLDAHLTSWRLEAGAAVIASGTTAVSGLLAEWDTAGLSGPQTVRLSATDLLGRASVVSAEVLLGAPARVLVLGGGKALNKPRGIAAAAGRIYVADTNHDRVQVYDLGGSLSASYGLQGRRIEPYLAKPGAVAADALGGVYVADTGHHRVVKLSAAGELLLELGDIRLKHGLKQFFAGSGPGQFKRPSGVAVDAAGVLYVLDSGNRRVQAFTPAGAFVRAFELPPAPLQGEDEEGEGGIAVDARGGLYVADSQGQRLLKFSLLGELLLDIESGLTRPEAVAVSAAGDCLVVSDREQGRVFRFDAQGRRTLSFGSPGEFNKPIGLALDAAGRLLVADRNHDRVVGYGPPGAVLAAAAAQRPQGKSNHAAARLGGQGAAGRVIRADRAAVDIPRGALAEEQEITVTSVDHADPDAGKRNEEMGKLGLNAASEPVEYGPQGLVFSLPVTLSLPYEPARLVEEGLSEAQLKVHHWNPLLKAWEALESTVDTAARTVNAQTTHFSLYQLMSTSAGPAPAGLAPAAGVSAAFGFVELYAFPNPSKAAVRPTVRVQVGLADSVQLDFYDVSGRRVHSTSLLSPQVLDDGNGKGPQYTYDYAWDASGVGSGVYACVMTAKKGGHGDIRKSAKIAVIR